MVQFLSIIFFLDFFNFCWGFQKFPFFCVTLYIFQCMLSRPCLRNGHSPSSFPARILYSFLIAVPSISLDLLILLSRQCLTRDNFSNLPLTLPSGIQVLSSATFLQTLSVIRILLAGCRERFHTHALQQMFSYLDIVLYFNVLGSKRDMFLRCNGSRVRKYTKC